MKIELGVPAPLPWTLGISTFQEEKKRNRQCVDKAGEVKLLVPLAERRVRLWPKCTLCFFQLDVIGACGPKFPFSDFLLTAVRAGQSATRAS
eukprot:3960944-Amphidinium_carterae.1